MAGTGTDFGRFVAVNGPSKSNSTGTDVTDLKDSALITRCQILILPISLIRLPLVFGTSGLEMGLWDGNYHGVTGAGRRIPNWLGTQVFNKCICFTYLSFK